MSLISAMITANEAAFESPDCFHYTNLQEFNSYVDGMEATDYPVNIVLPYKITSTYRPPFSFDTAIIRGYVVRRIEEDTNDWRTIDVEFKYISEMRELARQFIKEMLLQDLVDNKRDAASTMDPEYMFLHPHLFGVLYTLNLPVMQKLC